MDDLPGTVLYAGDERVPEVRLVPTSAFFDADGQPRYADPENPNEHSDDEHMRLVGSIDAHGVLEAVTFNRLTGTLLSGHGRLAAARDAHEPMIIVLVTEKDFVDHRAAAIALNGRYSHWNTSRLSDQLRTLQRRDYDLDRTGLPDVDIRSLIDYGGSAPPPIPQPDAGTDSPAAPQDSPADTAFPDDTQASGGQQPKTAECPRCGHVFRP